ncbi:MAG: pectin acetylesterase-family hydrolase [Acidimicrobiia bacterium]
MSSKGVARVLVVTTLVALAVGCGGGSDSSSDDSVVDQSTAVSEAPLATDAPSTEPPTTEPSVIDWETIAAPADCMCADGSPYSYFVREADPTKVMFYLEGGGACFTGAMCAPGSDSYKQVIGAAPGEQANGIFDFANPENPFADYSIVYVPYCTGDVHSGNTTKDYGDGVVVEHKGFVNASAALTTMIQRFPDLVDLVVAGSSAGAFTTPLYAGVAADQLPNAKVAVIADSGGAVPDAISAVTANWGTVESLPDWPEFAGTTAAMVTPAYSFAKVAEHNPSITFLRHDYAYDRILSGYAVMAGLSPDGLVDVMRSGEASIEATGAAVAAWVSPGDAHTILGRADFYTEELDGVRFLDWLLAFLNGTPLADNYCVECSG